MNTINITHPTLMKEWDDIMNSQNGIFPENFTFGSSQKVFWKCAKNHSWERSITSRTNSKYNCPKCKNLRNGSLIDNNPSILKIWDFEKNTEVNPNEIATHHKEAVFWKCEYGHEWKQSPGRVIVKAIPCTICSRVKNGSLLSLFPDVAKGLHPTKNGDIDPQWLAPRSNERFIWVCENHHEWEAPVNRVSQNGLGCPQCPRTSKNVKHPVILNSEFAKFWDVDKNNELGIDGEKIRLGSGIKAYWKCDEGHIWFMRISLFASNKKECQECLVGKKSSGGYIKHPKLSTGSPLVASEWHPTKNNNLTPDDVSTASGKSVWWLCENGHEWKNSISNRTIIYQSCKICRNTLRGNVFESEAINEWDYAKNQNTNPNDISISSRKKYWWICKEGHSWKTSPSVRIINKHLCPDCNHLKNGTLEEKFPEIAKQWSTLNENKPSEISYGSKKKAFWKCDNDHTWETAIGNRTGKNNSGCPDCNPQFSKGEKELVDFLKEHGINIQENRRDLLPGTQLELDIYIPEKKIAIEFNGVYWHSEKFGKDRNYHKNKVDLCEANGIRLIQVWEDDWNLRKDIVKAGLLHRLGISSQESIPARKMIVQSVNSSIAKDFLNSYHIQGFASGSAYFALYLKDEILFSEPYAVVSFTIRGEEAYLERFATRVIIPGGFTKMSKYAEEFLKTQGVKQLITFADKSLSQGNLYEKTGWIVDKMLDPDYSYLFNGERKHKFGFRLKRFRNDPALKYKEGLTEKELAKLNNIPRIWDSGKIRYIKNI